MKIRHFSNHWFNMIPVLLLVARALAGANKDFPTVDDTSYTEPNGDRVIQLSILVPASTNDVWRAITTAEGWKSFAVSFANMELKVGGIIETSYNPKAAVGDPDNIKNEIVAYVPSRMLAIRCVQAPRNFEHRKEFFETSTVFELISLGVKETRVVLTAVGYRPGEAYDMLFKNFRWGDAFTLEKLRSRFSTGQSAAPAETEETQKFNAAAGKR